jgi:hypothetical protein
MASPGTADMIVMSLEFFLEEKFDILDIKLKKINTSICSLKKEIKILKKTVDKPKDK